MVPSLSINVVAVVIFAIHNRYVDGQAFRWEYNHIQGSKCSFSELYDRLVLHSNDFCFISHNFALLRRLRREWFGCYYWG